MATNPTRQQQQACDQFAEALVLVAEGARLDGKGTFDQERIRELAVRIASASSAFSVEEIVSRAVVRRGKTLGLRKGIAECLTFFDETVSAYAVLTMSDAEFKELAERLEEELGEV